MEGEDRGCQMRNDRQLGGERSHAMKLTPTLCDLFPRTSILFSQPDELRSAARRLPLVEQRIGVGILDVRVNGVRSTRR
jgi:hypothetical protein